MAVDVVEGSAGEMLRETVDVDVVEREQRQMKILYQLLRGLRRYSYRDRCE